MRLLPNMTVLEPGDATEVESVLDVAEQVPGPVYIRMLRGEVPRLFPKSEPMELDVPRRLGRGGSAGRPAVVAASAAASDSSSGWASYGGTSG